MFNKFNVSFVIFFLISLVDLHLQSQPVTVFDRWHKTDQLIRDRKIDKDDAIDSIIKYVPLAVAEFKAKNVPSTKRADWVFPMSGWTTVTYRTNGKDYKDEFFDYFQAGEFKGHPAHDIFIIDKASNVAEDSTGWQVYATALVT